MSLPVRLGPAIPRGLAFTFVQLSYVHSDNKIKMILKALSLLCRKLSWHKKVLFHSRFMIYEVYVVVVHTTYYNLSVTYEREP